MHESVTFNIPVEIKVFQAYMPNIYAIICVYDIYAKISVYEIKIGRMNAPLILHHNLMSMNEC